MGAYGISLSGFLALHILEGEIFNGIALINNMLHLMLLPALVLFPLALGLRQWLLVAVLVVPFGVAVMDTAPALFNRPLDAPPGSSEVTVLTYNLLWRSGGLAVFADSIAIIETADADIVALQELSFEARDVLGQALADVYPYRALYGMANGTQGQGLLSKYPITDHRYFQSDTVVQLGHMEATLRIDQREIAVINAHPVHPFMSPGADVSVRGADVANVLDVALAAAAQRPTILLGDFNLTPKTDDYDRITAHFTDVYGVVGRGLGYTFPVTSANGQLSLLLPPLARLDYVFVGDGWQPVSAQVWRESGGSDHRPMLARLALLPPDEPGSTMNGTR